MIEEQQQLKHLLCKILNRTVVAWGNIAHEVWADQNGKEYMVILPQGSVHTIHFSDPIIFLALSQLIEMLIRITNFFEFEK